MKFLIQFLILASTSLLMTGCCTLAKYCDLKPEVRTEYVYLKTPVPALPIKPVFNPYTIDKLVFNDQEFYVMDPINAGVLGLNWENSKAYALKLEAILGSLSDLNTSETINTK